MTSILTTRTSAATSRLDDLVRMASAKGDRQLTMFGSGNAELRDRIKRLRLVRRWDQSTLADKAGVSSATVSNLELGRVAPTRDHIERIAAALGYAPDFLTTELAMLPTTRPWLRLC